MYKLIIYYPRTVAANNGLTAVSNLIPVQGQKNHYLRLKYSKEEEYNTYIVSHLS